MQFIISIDDDTSPMGWKRVETANKIGEVLTEYFGHLNLRVTDAQAVSA